MDNVADLEIVAGAVWNAVGGDVEDAVEGVSDGTVQVRQVDPKRFGVEVAAGTSVVFVTGEEGDTKQVVLATLRPFKPMDLIVTERQRVAGVTSITAGLSATRGVDIGGVQQFTSKNPVNNACFGSTLSAPRPKIRFDTVQTSPSLSMDVTYNGPAIAPGDAFFVDVTFGGVAVKR